MNERDRYDSLFRWYGEHNPVGLVDWVAIKAQALAESRLDPFAKSSVGAVGLMQFMAPTWMEWYARIHPGVPPEPRTCAERSIELGSAYMADLTQRFGNSITARAAYNWGMGNVKHHLDQNGGKLKLDALPEETASYLLRIDKLYSELLAEMGGNVRC